jgi:hypothetical protein
VTVELPVLLELFHDEAAEHLTDLEAVLLTLKPCDPDPDGLELMLRAARSAKASSITLGLADVTELVHQFERLLECLVREQVAATLELREAALHACAVLRALLAAHRGSGSVETARAERACQRLQALGGRAGSGAVAPAGRAPAFPDAGDPGVLPVGWRGQVRRAPGRAQDAQRPVGQLGAAEALTREPPGRRQDRQGRAGAGARRKP